MKKLISLAFFCLLLMPAQAQESVQAFLKHAIPNATPYDIRQVGDWAFCGLQYGTEGEGQALIHRYGNGWEIATAGGGAISAHEFAVYGVPRQQWEKLFNRTLGQEELAGAREAFSQPVWTWLTRDRTIKTDDLELYTALELTLMRNEVFAVHGRVFNDPYLKALFATRTWYHPNPNFSEASLSQRERANVNFISSYQKKTGKL